MAFKTLVMSSFSGMISKFLHFPGNIRFYWGDDCQYDFDECKFGNPCYHRGKCENTFGSWRCLCLQGWRNGVHNHCENKTNPDINFRKCMPGWMGDMCENQCLNDQMCGPNQMCKKKGRGKLCLCRDEWKGDNCDIDVDECDTKPCKPYEICLNSAGSYSCSCPSGWQGPSCSDDVDECLTNPCKHSGMCINTQGAYICNCTSHWTGRNCEENSIKAGFWSMKTYIGVMVLAFLLLLLLCIVIVIIIKNRCKKRKKVRPRRNEEKRKVIHIKERVSIYE
ncbi:protein crumbs homolog 2-like [Ruditapes philippinarum]|uniref:protein crumbs homolog 2-like n=1 Tax=Ruditapes philippinarum TaxID=129788 RepID=UPI00295B401C|nr:protein crumbs homolog 2-like [Ruditapes philippinarum]